MEKVRRDNWVKCPSCGHKLFKYNGKMIPAVSEQLTAGSSDAIEIKCHSCKKIIEITRCL